MSLFRKAIRPASSATRKIRAKRNRDSLIHPYRLQQPTHVESRTKPYKTMGKHAAHHRREDQKKSCLSPSIRKPDRAYARSGFCITSHGEKESIALCNRPSAFARIEARPTFPSSGIHQCQPNAASLKIETAAHCESSANRSGKRKRQSDGQNGRNRVTRLSKLALRCSLALSGLALGGGIALSSRVALG